MITQIQAFTRSDNDVFTGMETYSVPYDGDVWGRAYACGYNSNHLGSPMQNVRDCLTASGFTRVNVITYGGGDGDPATIGEIWQASS